MGTYRFFIEVLITATYVYVTFGAPAVKNSEFGQYTLCTTDQCINAASEILASLNRTVDPCDDFYKFACGGWIENNRANLSMPHVSVNVIVEQNTEKYIREILQGPSKPNDTVSLLKVKHIYAQCVNNENGQANDNNFSKIINKYVEWPLLLSRSEWEARNLTWHDVSATLHKNGFNNGLYNIKVIRFMSDIFNSYFISISDTLYYLPRRNMIRLNETGQKESYKSHIVRIASILLEESGRTIEIENLTQDALDIIHFEMELAICSQLSVNTRDIDRTIQDFQEEFDETNPGTKTKIDWHSTIQEMFAPVGIAIDPFEIIFVQAYTYLINLVLLLERTPSRTVVNYMVWTFIRKFSTYIKTPKVSNDTAHATISTNSTQHKNDDNTWKKCMQICMSFSTYAISHEFVKTYTLYENIQHIREISNDIENETREQIKKAVWMDESTRDASLEKLANIRYNFMSPEWYSNEAIDKYYESLNVSTEFFGSIININQFYRKQILNLLRTPIDEKEWNTDLTELDAFYDGYINTITITAGYLQSPFYNRSRLPVMNYASLGFTIAHEIHHGFDTTCHMFDKDGYEERRWTQTSIDAYENITQCFIDQYDEYLVPKFENENLYVNGSVTVDENIADSAGIAATYYAYKNRKARLNEPEWRLQGLEEYNEDQIFFMSFAQMWCADTRPEKIKEYFFDVHPHDEIRIRGSLSNLREFSDAYNCSVGKPMNPEKKCALW